MKSTLRSLLRRPVFSLTVVGTLALGLGLATAILSLLTEIYLKPLPYPDAARLGLLFGTYPERGWHRASVSVPEVWDVAQRSTLFESTHVFAAFRNLNLTGHGPSEVIETNFCEAGHLTAQGARPLLGRLFTAAETTRDSATPVVILAYRFWKNRLGLAPDVLGTTIELNGRPFTVIGVLPEDYRDIGERWQPTEIFVPLGFAPLAYQAGMFEQRGAREFYGLVRLKPGATAAQAQQELDRIAAELARAHPADHEGRGLRLLSLREYFYGDIDRLALALGAGAAFVLLITCVNLAHLLLVQGESRRGELAVRAALGASRGELVRQTLMSVGVLSALGAGAGLALGFALVGIFNREGVLQVPTFTVFSVSPAAVAGALALTLACAAGFGVLPAWRASRVDLRAALQSSAARSTGGRAETLRRHTLIAAEVALATLLLVGAGLTAVSLRQLAATPPGYNPDRLLTATFELDRGRYPNRPALTAALRRIETELAALPGAPDVTLWGMRILGRASYNVFTTPGPLDPAERQNQFMTRRLHVMPDGFRVLDIPLLAGGTFSPTLAPDREPYEVVIGENYARRFWPDKPLPEIVGQTVFIHSGSPRPARVVGIAADVKHSGRTYDERQLIGDVYLSQHQWGVASQAVLLRYRGDPAALPAGIKAALARFDPEIALTDVATMNTRLEREQGVQELTASLFGVYATLATLLAAVGVYGVLSFAVARRTREFGVRLAVGARPGQVLGRVLRQGTAWIGLGVAAGLLVAWHASSALQGLLVPGVSATDARVFLTCGAAVLALGIFACLVPAWRASRTDPLVALRSE